MRLTKFEEIFVESYIITRDSFISACEAGVDKRHAKAKGDLMLSSPIIIEAINDKIDELTACTGLNPEWVLRKARRLYERCAGELIGLKTEKFDAKNALSALSLIDKIITKTDGAESDLPIININVGTTEDFKVL